MQEAENRKGPLKSLKVIELANVVAGPFAGSLLADWGADVIKIEMPETGDPFRQFLPNKDGESLRWITMGRNKRCATLNLKSSEGKKIFLDLVKESDLIIENFRPGTIEKWGVGFDVMKSVNSKIVLARISGYGQDGPYREKAGFGTPATAYSGFTAIQGYPDRAPVSPPVALADELAGMFAVMGGLSAVYSILKGDSKEGQVVDVSLYEPLVRILESQITEYSVTGRKTTRTEMAKGTASPAYIFKTKDNKWVVIVASTQKTWERMPEAMNMPQLLTDPRFITNQDRVMNDAELCEIINNWTLTLDMDRVCSILDKAGIPTSPVNEADDLKKDPQFISRDSITKVHHPILGDVDVPNIFPKFSDTVCEIRHSGQKIGQANEEIYKGMLGITDEEFEVLKENKTI